MKAFFLPLGAGAERALPAVLTALSCGAARQPASVDMLRIPSRASDGLASGLLKDIRSCHAFLAGRDEFAFFRTAWQDALWLPNLPGRDALMEGEESALLLSALRGEGVPFSFRTDREAAEWSMSALLEKIPAVLPLPEAQADPVLSGMAPFLGFLSRLEAALSAGEEVRILLLCDLSEGYAAGLALSLIRFLRARFPDPAPFIGLVCQVRSAGADAWDRLGDVRDALADLSRRSLVRVSEDRETPGADACWLLGLPASLISGEEGFRLLDWASARILGEVWTSAARPSAGLHTRELPGVVTLQALDQEAKSAAAFLRGAFWCLSDIFPALHSWFEHPALLRSLAPASRGGLFRRLFRDRDAAADPPPELAFLERALRALGLEILSLLRALPPLLREADPASGLWAQAVRACGRTVTLASEYDVSRKEAEDSGVDKVAPVHRVSLSDTEEEALLRKLDNMASALASATEERSAALDQLGGFFGRAALEDCQARCRVAETTAREKLVAMPSGDPEARYALGLQERRVRLLKAAVARCGQDLEEDVSRPALSRPAAMKATSPFAGEVLDPALAEQAFLLLTSEGEAAENAAKAVRDGLGALLKGFQLNDAKMLLKNLATTCRRPEAEAPLRDLAVGAFSVCGVEVSGLRFQSAGSLPPVPLLPDLSGEGRVFSLSAAAERLIAPPTPDPTARNRGLLALMLLRQYRRPAPGDASLELTPLQSGSSALLRVYLASRGVDHAFLCSLRGEGESRLPLAVLLPGVGLEAARLQPARLDLIPSFVFWLDREALTFRDPCPYFSEGDRQVLTEQLTRLRAGLRSPQRRALNDFCSDWHQDIMQAPRQEEDAEALRRRLRVVCGLTRLPVWQKDLKRVSAFYEPAVPGQDPVCAALCGVDAVDSASCKIREDVLYVFRGVPVARENALRLLEATHAPEEAHYLSSLNTECDILLQSSDDYHEALAAGVRELLDRFPAADPEVRAVAEEVLEEAARPIQDRVTELSWPWDTVSSSVLTILTECLGPELAAAALRAFSDRLALFPARGGEVLGDVLFSGLCTVPRSLPDPEPDPGATPEAASAGDAADSAGEAPAPVRSDAVLPPLSPEFAAALCRSPRGQSLIQPGFLSFSAEGAGVRAELSLEGAFSLKLIRVYGPEEILTFYAHDLPTLALWPSLPFAPEDWHAYFSYAHCAPEFRFTAVTRSGETELSGAAPRQASRTADYPLCYLVSHGDLTLGAVPNLLPSPELPDRGTWTACVDFGASAASVIFSDGSARWPMQGPVAVRTLLRSPAATEDLLWREFLPAVPVTALLPGALRIFRNDLSDSDLPLRDASVFMSSSLRDVLDIPPEALYTDLKWNGEKGRAAGLYLHQVMLMAALEARCGGAKRLRWLAALPDEMAPEGRERLAELFRSLAEEISRESGLPLPEKQPPVAFAPESSALGAYFRYCSPEETRGGFMVLDLGADTADLSLYLQGREDAVRSCQLPLGVHNMLLPELLRNPGLLLEDFGFVEQEDFRRDLEDFRSLLERAGRNPDALRQARCGLDAILADHLPLFAEALFRRRAGGSPGRTGALILLHESFLMMLAGLALLQMAGDASRNDFLPESMTLFLAGRGSLLPEAMSPQARTSLWRILTMFRNPRVASLNLLFSAEKKLEIPVGLSLLSRPTAVLPRPAASPAAVAVRPEELLPEFLLRFRREFPQEAELLFPGVFANDYYAPFTPFGGQLLSQALQAAFGQREAGRPFPALVSCLSHLLNMVQEGGPLP